MPTPHLIAESERVAAGLAYARETLGDGASLSSPRLDAYHALLSDYAVRIGVLPPHEWRAATFARIESDPKFRKTWAARYGKKKAMEPEA